MSLQSYFKEQTGTGVLSTADQDGHVNAAVYARPHCFDDGTVGFIMPDRLTHENLKTNGHAVYLFHQDPNGDDERRFSGKRLYLRKVREDDDQERIASLRRRTYGDWRDGRHLVIFEVEKELPLVGAGDVE